MPQELSGTEARAIVEGAHRDPFAVLGPHEADGGVLIRAFIQGAESLEVIESATGHSLGELARRHGDGLFEGLIRDKPSWLAYRLRAGRGANSWEVEDPYRLGPVLGEIDNHLLAEGTHQRLYERLGAHILTHEGLDGVHFSTWAPNAQRVSVVGDFNGWDGRRHPMRHHPPTGIWEIFIPGLGEGAVYKYEIRTAQGMILPLKADPVGFAAEFRPETASLVADTRFSWADSDWMERRAQAHDIQAPVSIYEVHLGSWQRGPEGRFLSYDELGDRLVPYVQEMGFTHVELLPISEHPFDGSWGYQPIGLFAPTARFGSPSGFARLVDRFHAAGIGVLLDWVPGHFPTDRHGLGRYDGTALYEHEDPRQGFHQDWNTLIYNYGRPEVRNYLLANVLFWLERYHVDGLRVDAVASMLYLDYSRKEGEWIPNRHGGRENLEAVDFLRRMNELSYGEYPGIVTVAEESTSWPGVSKPTWTGGLGFGFKWNMGWMNDTLDYMSKDPLYRRWHHHQLTFGLLYAFSENFVLPLSHDEVVHGKGTLLSRMPGDRWRKFANLRAYYAFMWGHPGKKLLFMGQEFAQAAEWSEARALDWHLLDDSAHQGMRDLVRDLNRLYCETPALHRLDCHPDGFEWLEANDAERSVLAWLRKSDGDDPPVLVVSNLTPAPHDYRLGLPAAGCWREILNTDASTYGGSGDGNAGAVTTESMASHGRAHSVPLRLPPLSTLWLVHEGS